MTGFIVTRPAQQAAELINAITQLGHHASSIPLLSIEPIEPNVDDLQCDSAIFISPNAVKFAHQQLSTSQWQQLTQAQVFAIGESTHKALCHTQITHAQYPQQANSEGLLQCAGLQQVAGMQIFLVSGQGGRELIEQTLAERGAKIKKIAVYRRLPVKKETVTSQLPSIAGDPIWIISSLEALQHLHHCVTKPVKLLVTSERLNRFAQELHMQVVTQSKSALTKDIIKSLKSV